MKTIVVATAGWVFAGTETEATPTSIALTDAVCIRRWGTTKGLGQLALKGPTKDTVLEECGTVTIEQRHVILRITCPGWK